MNMGRGLYESEPVFRSQVDECAEILQPHLGKDLRTILYPSDEDAAAAQDELTQTAITQPALFVTSYALAKLWEHWGIEPDAMIGHSLGDYVAACLAGVFTRDDALALVARRARLMQDLPSGAMLAVRATPDEIGPFLGPSVSIAGLNAPKLTVISGDHEAVSSVAEELESRGLAARRLATSHAFHSPMMEPIVERFARDRRASAAQRAADAVRLEPDRRLDHRRAGHRPSVLGTPAARARSLLGRRRRSSSRIHGGPSSKSGPGETLTKLVRQQPGRAASQAVIASLARDRETGADMRSMLGAAGRLWIAGATLDWDGVHGNARRLRVPLPTYPFERKRHWVDPVLPDVGQESFPPPTQAPRGRIR